MTVIVQEYDTAIAVCKALGIEFNDIDVYEAHDIRANIIRLETSRGTFICESFEDDTKCRRCDTNNDKNHKHEIYMKVTELAGAPMAG